jgi:malic enzyme
VPALLPWEGSDRIYDRRWIHDDPAAMAEAIAATVTDDELNAAYIVPSVFHPDVSTAVAAAVSKAVRNAGTSVAPVEPEPLHA